MAEKRERQVVSISVDPDSVKLIGAAMTIAGRQNRSGFILDCVIAQIKGTIMESLVPFIGKATGFEFKGRYQNSKIPLVIAVGNIAGLEKVTVSDLKLGDGEYTLLIETEPERLLSIIQQLKFATSNNPSIQALGREDK